MLGSAESQVGESAVKLFSKNSNACDHNPPTLQADGREDSQLITAIPRSATLRTILMNAFRLLHTVSETTNVGSSFLTLCTRKLCCRKDDRAMRHIHGGPEFSGLPDYAHGYYSQQFSWSFVPIDPMNVPTKFELRSFTRS